MRMKSDMRNTDIARDEFHKLYDEVESIRDKDTLSKVLVMMVMNSGLEKDEERLDALLEKVLRYPEKLLGQGAHDIARKVVKMLKGFNRYHGSHNMRLKPFAKNDVYESDGRKKELNEGGWSKPKIDVERLRAAVPEAEEKANEENVGTVANAYDSVDSKGRPWKVYPTFGVTVDDRGNIILRDGFIDDSFPRGEAKWSLDRRTEGYITDLRAFLDLLSQSYQMSSPNKDEGLEWKIVGHDWDSNNIFCMYKVKVSPYALSDGEYILNGKAQ